MSTTDPGPNPVSLNVASWLDRSVVNGPGERFVLWLQGCPFRCPGCFNPDYLEWIERQRMSVSDVAAVIGRVVGIDGVTFSGGEPMAQAEGLYSLCQALRPRGLSIMCYSGYTIDELEKLEDPFVTKLLGCLDLLVDGRYDPAQRANLPWRGSKNQRVHLLSDAYRPLAPRLDEPRTEVEFVVGREGFVTTGIFDPALTRRLERAVKEGQGR